MLCFYNTVLPVVWSCAQVFAFALYNVPHMKYNCSQRSPVVSFFFWTWIRPIFHPRTLHRHIYQGQCGGPTYNCCAYQPPLMPSLIALPTAVRARSATSAWARQTLIEGWKLHEVFPASVTSAMEREILRGQQRRERERDEQAFAAQHPGTFNVEDDVRDELEARLEKEVRRKASHLDDAGIKRVAKAVLHQFLRELRRKDPNAQRSLRIDIMDKDWRSLPPSTLPFSLPPGNGVHQVNAGRRGGV